MINRKLSTKKKGKKKGEGNTENNLLTLLMFRKCGIKKVKVKKKRKRKIKLSSYQLDQRVKYDQRNPFSQGKLLSYRWVMIS